MKHRIISEMQADHWLRVCNNYLNHYKLLGGQRRTLQNIRRNIMANQVVTKSQIERIKEAKP